MCTIQPRVRTESRECAPETFPCPTCGVPGRRKGLHTRTVRCLAYQEILLIELTTAEYRACCSCCKTFRSQVEGILPRAEYTNKVREAVLDRLLDDKMSVERLRGALLRDFHLDLSEHTLAMEVLRCGVVRSLAPPPLSESLLFLPPRPALSPFFPGAEVSSHEPGFAQRG